MQAPLIPFWLTLARAERVIILWFALLFATAGIAWFGGALALVEPRETRLVLLGGLARLLADLLMLAFPVMAIARVRACGLWVMWQVAPVGDGRQVLAASAALWMMALALALTLLPLLVLAGAAPTAALAYAAGLWLEAGLVAQMALLPALRFAAPLTGLAAGLAMLVFARLAGEMVGAAAAGMPHWAGLYEALALIVPRLDLYADGAALAEGRAALPLLALLQAPAYGALFLALGMIQGVKR